MFLLNPAESKILAGFFNYNSKLSLSLRNFIFAYYSNSQVVKKIVILTLFYGLISSVLLFGQTDKISYLDVEDNLMAQLEAWPQEKIHLHTDRDYYVPGEKIWFKAYVTDAATHQYPTFSKYLYVELIDANSKVVNRAMIRLENKMFYGQLFLSERIPEGNYTLRAYTRYMENLGDDYFFKKNIRIGSLNSSQFSVLSFRKKNGENRDDFDVAFFPEGGNVVEGFFCRVAFKALNSNGYSATVTGEIINENGTKITSVETLHAGMGVFGYTPATGKRFFLKCRNETGVEKQFELPQPDPRACALTAAQQNKKILIGLHQSAHHPENPCYLLAHCRGEILYFEKWNSQTGYIIFAEEDLPAGVIQFILFDEQMNPLSERLVFSKNFDGAKVDFQTDKPAYEKREKVTVTIKPPLTPPEEGNAPSLSERAGGEAEPNFSHFSVAITDDHDIAIDSTTTILSSLLLSSELKGYIENPAWYLQDNRVSATALDYLMMTHGWRRYNIPEVVKGNLDEPHIPFQTNRKISGRVKSLTSSRPLVNSEVTVLSKEGDFISTLTDENGAFQFDDLTFPDTTSFFLQALGSKGSSNVELVMDGDSFPAPVYALQTPHLTPTLSEGEGVETEWRRSTPRLRTQTLLSRRRSSAPSMMKI